MRNVARLFGANVSRKYPMYSRSDAAASVDASAKSPNIWRSSRSRKARGRSFSIKLNTPSNDSIATFTKRPGASDTFSRAASINRGVCRSFDPMRRARSGKSAYANNTCVARLFARSSAYTRGLRSQSRTSSNAYRRLRMQSPSIRRSSRS